MFVNYFHDPTRQTPINTSVARLLLSGYALWKLLSYGWLSLTTWPELLFATTEPGANLAGRLVTTTPLLVLEVLLAAVALCCLFVGYRIAVSAFLSALLLAHLTGVHYSITNQASTFLPVVYLCLLFALYSDEEQLSLDRVRALRATPTAELATALLTDRDSASRHTTLKWGLVLLALTYFFTGWAKVTNGVTEWVQGQNVGRIILWEGTAHVGTIPVVGTALLGQPLLLDVTAILTVVLEVGFLLAVLLRLPLTPIVVGLAGMHTGIALTMHIFFFDQYLLYLLFVPWDRLARTLVADDPVSVTYDRRDSRCVRTLAFVRRFEPHGDWTLTPDDSLDTDTTTPFATLTVEIGGSRQTGIDAVQQLLARTVILYPVAIALEPAVVRRVL